MEPLRSVPDPSPVPVTHCCQHAAEADELRTKVANLEIALTTSRLISTAVGVLMATFKATNDAAFDMLVVASQNTHRKLRDIAQDVVDTGTLNWGRGMMRAPHDSARGPIRSA